MLNHASQPYKAIFALAWEGGLRRSEILLLKIADLQDCGDYIKVTVRNSKSEPRTVLIIRFKDIIRDWLRKHKWRRDKEAYLFPAKTAGPYEPLSPRTLANYMKRLKEKLKLRRIWPHLLRHKRATELYKDLKEKEMMEYFGWKTRTMLDIYARITERDVHMRILQLYGIEPQPPTPKEVMELKEAKQLIDKLIQLALTKPDLLRTLLQS